MEIIFDFDGTIADSLGGLVRILNRLKDELGFPEITEKEIAVYRENGAREAIKILKVPVWRLPKIIKRTQSEQLKEAENLKPVDGLKEVLVKLKENGFQLGILTSNTKENVEKFLKKNQIDLFSYIYSEKNLFGKDKVIKHLINKRDLDPDEVIYVGDEVRDIEACKKAGIKMIAVSWGFNSRKILEKYQPEFLADLPAQILDVFKL